MTKQSSTVLKTYFETGDVPTQAQYADLIDSFANLTDDNLLQGYESVNANVSPPSQGTATALTKLVNKVTTNHTAGDGVLLPAGLVGRSIIIGNYGSDKLYIYPASGGSIGGLATNAPLILYASQFVILTCYSSGIWYGFKHGLLSQQPNQTIMFISQSGTSAPTASYMQSMFQVSPTLARSSTGVYTLTANTQFTSNQVAFSGNLGESAVGFVKCRVSSSPNVIEIKTYNASGVLSDDILNNYNLIIYQLP